MVISTPKKILSLLMVSAVLFSFTTAKVYQTDFSGTWAFSEGKSEVGLFGGRGIAQSIVVNQKSGDITFNKTYNNNGEEVKTTESLTADGKESETTVFNNAKKKSTLKWSADGQTFTVNYSIAFDMNGQTFELKGVETWSLSADGKTATINTVLTTPQGEANVKAVYDKK